MATYKHLRSSTANKRPTTGIADGQLAINTNTASPGLFFKDSAGTGIVKVGPVHVGTTAPNSVPASGGSTGNYKGEQWLDTSVSPAQLKVWNGSAWVGVVADELPVSKLQDGDARQLLQTDAAGTGVEWTSNVDVPGTLDVTSTATFDSIASHPLGSAAAPTITFTGDTNTGLYSPGADQVAISTAGTGRLFVDSSGNVGVGTANPSQKLTVGTGSETGAHFVRIHGANSNIYIGQSAGTVFGAATGSMNFIGSDANVPFGVGTILSQPLVFGTLNSERLRITSDGKVGLGTSVPSSLLELFSGGDATLTLTGNLASGSNVSSVDFKRIGGTVNASIQSVSSGSNDAGALYLSTRPNGGSLTQRLYITPTGNVGVGTTSPSSLLHTSQASGFNIFQQDSGSVGNYLYADSTGQGWVGTRTNHPFVFGTNNSERARIDTSGRLLVGTSSTRNVGGFNGGMQLEATNSDASTFSITSNQNNALYPQITFGKTRSSTIGGVTAVQANDFLGVIRFCGADGSSLGSTAAFITCEVDGTPGTNDMPGRLVFSTTADGASSPTERMRIGSDGNVGIGSSNTSNIKLYVLGVDSTSSNWTHYAVDSAAATLFGVRNDGAFTTGSSTASPYNNTTASAANVVVDASGFLYRSTSSARFKINVEDLQDTYADNILNCRPVWYRSTANADDPTWGYWGFIAEEVAEVDPRLVFWKTKETKLRDDYVEEEGKAPGPADYVEVELDTPIADGVQYDRFVPHLVNLIKRQQQAIETLEAKVAALESA